MRKSLVALVAFAAVVGLAGPSFATFPAKGHEATQLQVVSGSGSGTAVLTTIWHKRKICFNITSGVDTATTYTADLNQTAVTGLVARFFVTDPSGTHQGCIGPWQPGGPSSVGVYGGRAKLKQVIAHPELFDVSVSTDAGKLDGQLHRGVTP